MAGKLRASYDATIELDEGKERKFTAEFCVAEDRSIQKAKSQA
jgi:hypothetical protein